RIDKKKKVLVTTFLQALGFSRDEILSHFYDFDVIDCRRGEFSRPVDEMLLGKRLEKGMLPDDQERLFVGRRVTKDILSKLKEDGIKQIKFKKISLLNRVVGKDIIDPETGEVLIEQGEVLAEHHLDIFNKMKQL